MKKVMAFFGLFLALFLTSCEKDILAPTQYYYEVTGTSGRYSVTLEGAPKGTAQYSNVGNGWKYTWTGGNGRWLYISAQNQNSTGSVTVKIVKNGKVVASQTSNGGYVIATVDGKY